MAKNTKPVTRRIRIVAIASALVAFGGAGLATYVNGYGRGPRAFLVVGAIVGVAFYVLAPLLAWTEKTRRPDPPDNRPLYP